ncbi:MAG: hypothetical protein U5K55_17085 [Aliarcobacter sp.]|nr:hypothetical protein [Aliarcobacter sp.]
MKNSESWKVYKIVLLDIIDYFLNVDKNIFKSITKSKRKQILKIISLDECLMILLMNLEY